MNAEKQAMVAHASAEKEAVLTEIRTVLGIVTAIEQSQAALDYIKQNHPGNRYVERPDVFTITISIVSAVAAGMFGFIALDFITAFIGGTSKQMTIPISMLGFVGLMVFSYLFWKNHSDHLATIRSTQYDKANAENIQRHHKLIKDGIELLRRTTDLPQAYWNTQALTHIRSSLQYDLAPNLQKALVLYDDEKFDLDLRDIRNRPLVLKSPDEELANQSI